MLENQSQEQAQPAPEEVEELNEKDLEDVSGGAISPPQKARQKISANKFDKVSLNPQPLPPRYLQGGKH